MQILQRQGYTNTPFWVLIDALINANQLKDTGKQFSCVITSDIYIQSQKKNPYLILGTTKLNGITKATANN